MASGRKQWSPFDVVTHTDLNGVADRGVMNFASAAARTSAIPSPENGMLTTLDTNPGTVYVYGSGSWQAKTFTSPAQTVTGMTSVQTLTTHTPSTSADTWSSWQSVGTSPSGTSYLTGIQIGGSGFGSPGAVLLEFSLDGGATVWRRALSGFYSGAGSAGPAQMLTARSCPSSSTIHVRSKVSIASATGVFIKLFWSQTAPTIQLSAAEDLWMTTTAGSAFGTWVTLGTVSAASRLVAVAADAGTDGGLGSGATPTVIARWVVGSGIPIMFGQNRAVPSGDLKITGYSGSWAWVLTEPV